MNIVELRDKRKALCELTEDIAERAIRFGSFDSLCKDKSIDKWYPYPIEEMKSPFEVTEDDILNHYFAFVNYVIGEIKNQVDDFGYEEENYVSETMDLLEEKYDWINKGIMASEQAENIFRDRKIFNGKSFCQIKNELFWKLESEKQKHEKVQQREDND